MSTHYSINSCTSITKLIAFPYNYFNHIKCVLINTSNREHTPFKLQPVTFKTIVFVMVIERLIDLIP